MRQDQVQGGGTTLADFVAGTVWADVAAQSHEAKRSILNFFATALGSSNDPAVAGVSKFEDATIFRPDVVSLRQKVRPVLDASLPDGAACVTIQLTSGETFSEIVMAAKGSLADPLSDRDIETKLRDCARLGGTDWGVNRIIDDVWRLERLADVARLMRR